MSVLLAIGFHSLADDINYNPSHHQHLVACQADFRLSNQPRLVILTRSRDLNVGAGSLYMSAAILAPIATPPFVLGFATSRRSTRTKPVRGTHETCLLQAAAAAIALLSIAYTCAKGISMSLQQSFEQ